MLDDHSNQNDRVHGRNYSDDAGKPGAVKAARRVWRGAFGTGQRCTSPGAYPTSGVPLNMRRCMCMTIPPRKKLVSSCETICSFTITSAYINRWTIKPLLPSIFGLRSRKESLRSRLQKHRGYEDERDMKFTCPSAFSASHEGGNCIFTRPCLLS